jgi:rhodanese-related sulfurtransferase
VVAVMSRIACRLTALVCLGMCACASHVSTQPVSGDASISAEHASQLFRQGLVRLVDTRSADERVGRPISGSLHIQFGPDHWLGSASREDESRFLAQVLEAGLSPNLQLVTVCNAGVRATAAATFLRSIGYLNSRSVVGGYYGNDRDPGWQFIE